MTPTILQIIATLFLLFALSRVFLRWKGAQIGMKEASLWSLLWTSILIVLWIPITTEWVSNVLGLSTDKPIDTLIYLSIVILFYLIYRGYAKHEQLEQELTRVVRLAAINEAEKTKRKK
jgi:hypothetical protein